MLSACELISPQIASATSTQGKMMHAVFSIPAKGANIAEYAKLHNASCGAKLAVSRDILAIYFE